MTHVSLAMEQKQTHIENRLVAAKGKGEGGGWTGGLGSVDANYYIENG